MKIEDVKKLMEEISEAFDLFNRKYEGSVMRYIGVLRKEIKNIIKKNDFDEYLEVKQEVGDQRRFVFFCNGEICLWKSPEYVFDFINKKHRKNGEWE